MDFAVDHIGQGILIATMSIGQWDTILETNYKMGGKLLELNDKEVPIAVYQLDLGICPICGGVLKVDIDTENETNVSCTSCDHKEFNEEVYHE